MTTATTHTPTFAIVAHDLYRDIHKGIRAELFAVTQEAGSLDPSDRDDRAALAVHIRSVGDLLRSHAEHEDGAILPVLERELPDLAARVADEHGKLDARLGGLSGLADLAGERHDVHRLYVELAAFTSAYLTHQDTEERLVMPALEAAIGVEAVMGLHQAIISAIPPQEMAASLAVMLPAMNVDDRTELLGGMQAGAPAEVFQGVWSLAKSLLPVADHTVLASRLGLA